MFDEAKLYTKPAIGRLIGRTPRTLDIWRARGLLPAPDVMLGGRQPAWRGATLNAAPAFVKAEAA